MKRLKESLWKVLWIVGTAIICIFYAYIVAFLNVVGNIILHMIRPSAIKDLDTTPFSITIFIGWIILIIISIWQYRRWRMRCSSCKKWGAMKLVRTEFLGEKDIHVLMEVKARNINRDVVGTNEQYVPGTRETYRNIYKCKYCGNAESGTYTEDRANV